MISRLGENSEVIFGLPRNIHQCHINKTRSCSHLRLSHLRLHAWHVCWGWHEGGELTQAEQQQSHGQNALGHHPGHQVMEEKYWENVGEWWEHAGKMVEKDGFSW